MLEQFWLFHCGWIRVPRPAFVAGTRLDFPRLPFLAGLAVHTELGPILIDAPFGRSGFKHLGKFIGTIARTAGFTFDTDWSVSARIEQLGYRVDEVEHVCMTHMHFDHTGGLSEVAEATIYISDTEWEHVTSLEGKHALRGGVQVEDFVGLSDQVQTYSMPAHFDVAPDGHDIFGDGSIRAVGLPGHSVGHVGLMLGFEDDSNILLAGDTAFDNSQISSSKSLGYFPRQVADSRREVKRSLRALRSFHAAHPDVQIVPSHDFELGERCFDGPTRMYDPETA